MQSSLLPLVILGLGVIVALLGYAYALWSETLQVNVRVSTGDGSVKVSDNPQIVLVCITHECCSNSSSNVDDEYCCSEENLTDNECCKCKCMPIPMYIDSNTSVSFMVPKTKHSLELWVIFKIENNGSIPLKYTETTINSPYQLIIVDEYYYHVSESSTWSLEDYLDLNDCPRLRIVGEDLPIVFEPNEGVVAVLHLKPLRGIGRSYWVTINAEVVQWNEG